MWIKALLLSSALVFGSLALPASADDGVRIVVRHGGYHAGWRHADARHDYRRGSRHYYDRSYAAHRYRHYVRPYVGYLWTHHRYLRPDAHHAIGHGDGRGRGYGHGRGRGHADDVGRGRRDGHRGDRDGPHRDIHGD